MNKWEIGEFIAKAIFSPIELIFKEFRKVFEKKGE